MIEVQEMGEKLYCEDQRMWQDKEGQGREQTAKVSVRNSEEGASTGVREAPLNKRMQIENP